MAKRYFMSFSIDAGGFGSQVTDQDPTNWRVSNPSKTLLFWKQVDQDEFPEDAEAVPCSQLSDKEAILDKLKGIESKLAYSLGPTRDVKTRHLQQALESTKELLALLERG